MNDGKRKILIDIGHPAHVHLFKNFIHNILNKGHQIFVLTKDVDSIKYLLNFYSIPYTIVGRKPDSILLKYLLQIKFILKTLIFVQKNKIDIGFGVSMTLPIISKFSRITTFGLDDDDTHETPIAAWFLNKSDYILTPDALAHENRGKHHIVYPSFHELAYLHPDHFIPDPTVLYEAGIKNDEPYFVIRFNAFKAHHDVGAKGLDRDQKRKLIHLLEGYGKVFITTEKEIEPEFEPYRLPVSPEKIHSLLYYATLFVGDSQTMTTEAALLGTPAFKCNSFAGKLSIPNEIEKKYQLCFSYLPAEFEEMVEKIIEHLKMDDLKKTFVTRRNKMLKEKTNFTSFLVRLVDGYSESFINNK